VVILTALGDEETHHRSLQASAVAFLKKPFHSDALVDAIRAAFA
jgi:DNA-binding response OmpR family regulator